MAAPRQLKTDLGGVIKLSISFLLPHKNIGCWRSSLKELFMIFTTYSAMCHTLTGLEKECH